MIVLWRSSSELLDYGQHAGSHEDKWAGWIPCKGSPVLRVIKQTEYGGYSVLLLRYGELEGWVFLDSVSATTSKYVGPSPAPTLDATQEWILRWQRLATLEAEATHFQP